MRDFEQWDREAHPTMQPETAINAADRLYFDVRKKDRRDGYNAALREAAEIAGRDDLGHVEAKAAILAMEVKR